MGLSRTMIGPLLACLVAVALGGLWGAWAAYREGPMDRTLVSLSLFLEAFPRIILYALVIRMVRFPGLQVNLLHVTLLFGLFRSQRLAWPCATTFGLSFARDTSRALSPSVSLREPSS